MRIFKGGSYLVSINKICDFLGIPHHKTLSDFIPEGSIIIIDQVDFTGDAFNETIQSNITELATDSHNSKKYLVILSISNPNFALKTLGCNGSEKINIMFSPLDLRWTVNEAKKYLLLKEMKEKELHNTIDLFKLCYCPKILRDYVFKINPDRNIFERRAENKNKQWNEFEIILPTNVINYYMI